MAIYEKLEARFMNNPKNNRNPNWNTKYNPLIWWYQKRITMYINWNISQSKKCFPY